MVLDILILKLQKVLKKKNRNCTFHFNIKVKKICKKKRIEMVLDILISKFIKKKRRIEMLLDRIIYTIHFYIAMIYVCW